MFSFLTHPQNQNSIKFQVERLQKKKKEDDNKRVVYFLSECSSSDLWLLVVLHGHGDDVEPYYDGDEQVQVVAGAHPVDEQPGGGVIRVVRLTLSFC